MNKVLSFLLMAFLTIGTLTNTQAEIENTLRQILFDLSQSGNQIWYATSEAPNKQNLAVIMIVKPDGSTSYQGIDVTKVNPMASSITFKNEDEALKYLDLLSFGGQSSSTTTITSTSNNSSSQQQTLSSPQQQTGSTTQQTMSSAPTQQQ